MTLDQARREFRTVSTAATAMVYAKVAKDCLVAGMIDTNTAATVAVELERAGFKLAMLELMK
jgi:hypothetical protein